MCSPRQALVTARRAMGILFAGTSVKSRTLEPIFLAVHIKGLGERILNGRLYLLYVHYGVMRLFRKKVIGIPFVIERQTEALEELETELCLFTV